jgi:hypothetical protein
MQNPIKSPSFFIGGKAIFTVANNKGDHYTYRIRKHKSNEVFFVSLLTGPDNNESYTYLGLYNPNNIEGQKVVTTAKSKYNSISTPVKVVNWAITMVFKGKNLPEGYSIQHEGKCCRCGRTLTTPESIENGIGPECSKMMFTK